MGKVTVVAIWLALFAGTVGVRHLLAQPSRTEEPQDPFIHFTNTVTKAALDAAPYRTPSLVGLPGLSNTDQGFLSEVSTFITAHKDGLRRCKDLIMAHSKRPTEYFEISFVAHPKSFSAGTPVVLQEIIVERSSLELSSEAEACIADEFSRLEPDVTATVPNHRMPYQMCFNANTK